MFGYLSLLDDTPELIANREAPNRIFNDWAMVLAKSFIGLTVTIAVPMFLPPLRTVLFQTVLRRDSTYRPSSIA